MTPLAIDWDDVLTRLPFLEPTLFERPDGIHGVGHTTRVAAIAHMSPERQDLIEFAMWHHDVDDRAVGDGDGLDDPESALSVLWHLKDADALDRIRLGPFDTGQTSCTSHTRCCQCQ
jgi:hypothetical protein